KVATIATGTAVGAGVGAAIGGGKGAGIGALAGGGASTLYAFTRKDLKKPKYEAQSGGSGGQVNQARMVGSGPATNLNNRTVANNDPYNRLAGPNGACVGSLLSSGSSSIY